MTDYHPMSSGGTGAIPDKDPFYVVKERVQGTMTQLSLDFDQWKDALAKTNTHKNPKFKQLTNAIKGSMRSLVPDLKDLEETVGIVLKNREKFKDITDAELTTRKKFIAETRAFVQEVNAAFTSQKTRAKIDRDQSEALTKSDLPATREDREARRETSDFIEGKRADRQVLEEKQDIVLDDMHAALERLGAMSEDIKKNLDESNRELGGLEQDIGDAKSAMDRAIKKMEKLLGTSDTPRLCCIFILFVTAVALFMVLVNGG